MKKSIKAHLKQCHLEPVEKTAKLPLPGVPVHFNHGVFFDDGFDYMQYLKSASELNDRQAFRITGIPENESVALADMDASTGDIREPVVDEPELPEDFDLPSDFEDECSELEDNFVEIAGGEPVRDDSDEAQSGASQCAISSQGNLPHNKVLMMERFLYGDNEGDQEPVSFPDASDASSLEWFADTDDSAALDRQFEKLVLHLKNRAKSTSQSEVTCTSVMSEGLLYGLSRDRRILSHQHRREEGLEEVDRDVKLITVAHANDFGDCPSTPLGSFSSDESSDSVPDIIAANSTQCSSKPNYLVLSTPSNTSKSLDISRPKVNENEVYQPALPRVCPELLVRKKGESVQEKRARKIAVKQHRAERQRIRKANRENFHVEQRKHLNTGISTVVLN